MLLRGVRLDTPAPDRVRALLADLGVAGPWVDDDTPDPDVLHLTDHDGVTRLTIGDPPPPLTARPIGRRISTLVTGRDVGASGTCVFPLYDLAHAALETPGGSIRALIAREDGATIAIAQNREDGTDLTLGFSLASLLERIERDCVFFGRGHLVALIDWFLDTVARVARVRMSPWREGRPPLLLSFDIEANAARRSVGRRVGRLAGVELNRLRLPRPLRGPRWIVSKNQLHDPDGVHVSRRLTLDLRRGRRGCAGSPPFVDQWQLHLGVPKPPPVRPSIDGDFTRWAGATCGRFTSFYCGGLPPRSAPGEELGFHSVAHEHFHQSDGAALQGELAAGRAAAGDDEHHAAVRAPGLCWSTDYFRALGPSGFTIDSSFREISPAQPTTPIRTDHGWWELPVTANLLHGDGVRPPWGPPGLLNMYAHDHDLRDETARRRFAERVATLLDAGYEPQGHVELVRWLEARRTNEMLAIEADDGGQITVRCQAAAGTAIAIAPDEAQLVTHDGEHTFTFRMDPEVVDA